MNDEYYARYQRHFTLTEVGEEGQVRLAQSKVLVVGAGGLGCPVLQYLVGAGVGHVAVIDGDQISLSNLHRQTLYTTEETGRFKSTVARDKLVKLNPTVQISAVAEFLTMELALKLFPDFDLIIDGTDNFEARYLINDAAVFTGKPFVSGSVFRHEGQVSVFNYQGGPTYRCLFPQRDLPGFGCAETGVLGPVTGAIGSIMAMEAIKVLLALPDVLSGKLLILNALNWSSSNLSFSRKEEQVALAKARVSNKESLSHVK
ncbi:MAG: HesA/MoeB/ThiF family protein [Marinoscillum sp.]|uniref:HesA/MoeB/ThiF family protein n=1 Tax=Marinoscillum sp. TaxID=2024838 RepID=UPI0032FE040B